KWLDELLALVYSNQQMVKEFFEKNYPKIKAPISEGTYVQWLDFREVGLSLEERDSFLNENQFFTNAGHIFGEEGEGYERICVVLPQKVLKNILENFLEALIEVKPL